MNCLLVSNLSLVKQRKRFVFVLVRYYGFLGILVEARYRKELLNLSYPAKHHIILYNVVAINLAYYFYQIDKLLK